jgi:hypothetical protein
MDVCAPDESGSTRFFLYTLRELFIYLSEKKVWSTGKAWPSNDTELIDSVFTVEACAASSPPSMVSISKNYLIRVGIEPEMICLRANALTTEPPGPEN